MDIQRLQGVAQMIVRQRVRMTVNQYEVRAALPDGGEGELLAFAQQKRMAFKEQVTLYADEEKQQPILGLEARQVIDVGATYDVTDAHDQPIGLFRSDFGKSLTRSTWHLEQPDIGTITGQERNKALAVLRRLINGLEFIPYHFDFTADGQEMFAMDKRWGLRDRYHVTISNPRIDRRLVLAMAVALDALQRR